MDNNHRLLQCIPPHHGGVQVLEVYSAEHPGRNLSVLSHVLWTEHCSQGVHKTDGACGSPSEVQGHPAASPDFKPPSWESPKDHMCCTWKTVFLVALASTNRCSKLQILSRDPRYLVFSNQGMSMRVLPGFIVRKYLDFTGGLSAKELLFRKVRGLSEQTIANWIKACVRFTHQHRPDVWVNAHE